MVVSLDPKLKGAGIAFLHLGVSFVHGQWSYRTGTKAPTALISWVQGFCICLVYVYYVCTSSHYLPLLVLAACCSSLGKNLDLKLQGVPNHIGDVVCHCCDKSGGASWVAAFFCQKHHWWNCSLYVKSFPHLVKVVSNSSIGSLIFKSAKVWGYTNA